MFLKKAISRYCDQSTVPPKIDGAAAFAGAWGAQYLAWPLRCIWRDAHVALKDNTPQTAITPR
jgi:hypothetical protein